MAKLSSFKFPLEIDPTTGGLKMSYASDVRKDNIKSLLTTLFYERLLNPDYGTPLYLFDIINNTALVNYRIQEVITKYVPDITATVVSEINSEGGLLIVIDWQWLEDTLNLQDPIELLINF